MKLPLQVVTAYPAAIKIKDDNCNTIATLLPQFKIEAEIIADAMNKSGRMTRALEAIREARDAHAASAMLGWPNSVINSSIIFEGGVPMPTEDQAFDDWAADAASWALGDGK